MYAPHQSHRAWEVTEAIPELDATAGSKILVTHSGVWVFREHPLHSRQLLIRNSHRLRPIAPGFGWPPALRQTGIGSGPGAETPEFETVGARVLRRKGHLTLLG